MKKILFIASLICLFLFSCATKNEITVKKIKQARAYRELGEAYLQAGNYTRALKKFLDAEKITSDDPILHNDLGLVYMQKDRVNLAILHFQKALELDPDYLFAQNNLGSAWCETKQWDKAIEIFLKLSDNLLYDTPHYPLSNIGLVYFKKKNYQLAEKFYDKALKIKPDFINAQYGLSQVYIATKRGQKAIDILNTAIIHYSKAPQLYLLLGIAYTMNGECNNANIKYKEVINLAPKSIYAKTARRELLLINCNFP